MKPNKPKTVPCKNCRDRITPKGNSSLNQYCDKEECQDAKIASVVKKVRQQTKKAVKEVNDKLKERYPIIYSKEYKSELQAEVNKLSRMIDAAFGYVTCLDCGKPFGNQIDGSHFHGRGANSTLRYHLDNIHSCKSDCNQYSDTHKQGYEAGLITRYGADYLEKVKNLPLKYPKIKLSEVEVVEKLKVVRKLIRTFESFVFTDAVQARQMLNTLIGIYK